MSLNANDLGDAMANAMKTVWLDIKKENFPLPDVPDDSKILFRSVALGLLTYLKAHQDDAIQKITQVFPPTVSGNERTFTVTHLEINTNP